MSAPLTTYRRGKPFTWSYSRLKNFETCPKRHYEVDIAKTVKEEESQALLYGNGLHKAFAARIGESTPLPLAYKEYEPLCASFVRPSIRVELQLAITQDMKPTEWFAKDVWFRAVVDYAIFAPPVAAIVDWKTGKIVEDSVQLALTAAVIFAHWHDVHKIRSRFYWLADDATTDADFTRDDMTGLWAGLWPRIEAMRKAHETSEYPAAPGRLCRNWCPVKSCIHHGR